MGRRLAWAFVLVLSGSPAFAETVVLDAVLRGNPFALAADADYTVPSPSGANVFVFDLAGVGAPIVSATLVVVNPPDGFASPQRSENYAVYAVTDVEGYGDAGAGALLGSIEVDQDSPTTLEIPLAAPILRVLERTDGLVALGGRLTTLKKSDGSEHLFAGTGPLSGVPAPQLVLTTDLGAPPASSSTLHVDDEADEETGDGSTAAPFASIAFALDLAAPGDVVQVAPGLYSERVFLKRDVELRGSGPEDTTIDVTPLPGGVAVVCANDARIEGFRVFDPGTQGLDGPAIDCTNQTSPEVARNVIEAPHKPAIALEGSHAWIHHNVIRGGGGASEAGAAIFSTGSPVIEDNEIESNGVSIFISSGPSEAASIQRNLLRGLVVAYPGSGVPQLIFASNLLLRSAPLPVGGVFVRGFGTQEMQIVGNTFYGTDGIEMASSSEANIANNILVNGTAGIRVVGGNVEIRNNDVFGNRAGFMGATTNYVGIDDQTGSNGNLSVDPDFVDAFFEDFRLRPDSPAVDAGSDGDVAGDEDFDGDARVVDVVDMGAQEHQPDEELPLPALPVEVDLLPGKAPNELKFTKVAKGNGKVAIAILSDDELDAPADVDIASLILEREPALRCSDKDVDRDDRRDLVCSFPLRGISLAGWPISEPPACVRGLTHGGRKLLGCDEVEIIAP